MVEKVPMSYLRFGLTGLLLLQSAWVLGKQVQLYQAGSTLMTQIIEAGQDKNGRRKLFLNVPDRFEYRHAFYPLGYWGMLLAPVSQDLGDFIWLASPFRPRTETRSLTTRPLIDKAIKASPFEVNTRGVEAYDQGKLMDSVMWADQTYVTDYHPDGALTLQSVGEIRAKPTSPAFLARPKQVVGTIQNIATLINATVTWQPNIATISLTWQAIAPAQPTDTIFVHLIDADGQVVAQADGDSLNGLIRPSAWQPGQLIIDQRQIQLNGIPTRGLQVRVGMYSRESGQRYAALLGSGQLAQDGALTIEPLP